MSENINNAKRIGIIDQFIGRKIKIRRIQFGISQKKLSDLLKITFQQLQKYENGSNRTPSSRLYELTKIFDIPINYFFEGLEEFLNENNSLLVNKKTGKYSKKLEAEILKLNRYFVKIEDVDTRRLIIEITKKFGNV